MLNSRQRAELLRLAREAMTAAVRGQTPPPAQVEDPILQTPAGAFVTLHKRGRLRGCIGQIEARDPLWKTVASTAVSSALHDYRFDPLQPEEVAEVELQVSVLTPPQRVEDLSTIEVGRHGLIVEQSGQRGLLLPQVATEWGWDREQFLSHTCEKAGLPPDAWRRGATVYAFTAEVFEEGGPSGREESAGAATN